MKQTETYKLRYFFDYNCGGCLWSGDKATREKYDAGTLDSEIFNLKGELVEDARIKLPVPTKEKVQKLDALFSESLNWENPSGPSPWSQLQWESFYEQARDLHAEICGILGDDFEVINEVEKRL